MPVDNASAVGTVFDIKQLAVYDGPGIRTTVFLKGCPLRCMWCHNPEGLSYQPQLMVSSNNCLHCGACVEACPNGGKSCTACGQCIRACPQGLRKLCGKRYTAQELAQKLLRDKDYLAAMSGGVTFSGGEPTGQPEFLLETLDRVAGMHRAIETSGYCSGSVFEAVLARVEYVMMDLKLMDPEQHRHYTGVSNEPLLAGSVLDADDLEQVELLPYHVTAGAKYEMVGLSYQPEFDTAAAPNLNTELFRRFGLKCTHL